MQDPNQSIPTHFHTEGLPPVIVHKLEGLVNLLNQPVVDVKTLRVFLGEGIPDEAVVLREYSWKIILGFLPEEKAHWQAQAQRQQETYELFVREFLPEEKFPDYPILMNKKHPKWEKFEEDFSLWEQIEKDTSRTHAELSFFSTPAAPIMIPYFTHPRREKFKIIHGEDDGAYKEFLASKELQRKTYRYDYMSRILYIYSKLNPRIQYVQGMNEILAPIFYLVNAGKPIGSPVEEASCFFMFNNAITDIIELHIKDLDKSENGIYGKLNRVNEMLVVIEPRIWARLEALKIDPFYYSFRWMTLLYSQEFALFDTLRIWESMFSYEHRLDFMNFFAIAIIVTAGDFILSHDFVEVLEYLQHIGESLNVRAAIDLANQLMEQFCDSDFKEEAIASKDHIKKKEDQAKEKKKSVQYKVLSKVSSFVKKII